MIKKRLIEFFKNSTFQNDERLGGIWDTMVTIHHAELINALKSGDVNQLETALKKPSALYGLEQGDLNRYDTKQGLELLNALGRRLGIVAEFNPEQPSPLGNWYIQDVNGLKSAIELIVGSLQCPEPFGRPKPTGDGFAYMYFHSLAQLFTLKMFLGKVPNAILELGAGAAYFGYCASRFGVHEYTIIDLPTTAVVGAYFISGCFGPQSVWLFGEPKNEMAYARFYPSTKFSDSAAKYDLICNSNSIPEMPPNVQDRYLEFIVSCLSENGSFYSYNHESDNVSQRSVRLAIGDKYGLKCVYRAPSFIRKGYVEEIYQKQ